MDIVYWAIPFFMASIFIEWKLSAGRALVGYRVRDTATSLGMGVGNLAILFSVRAITAAPFFVAYEYRILDLPISAWWVWLLLIPAEDFCYYWSHRAGHGIRLLWAAHVNHHSSTSYNLSTALRQSWTAWVFGWLFYLPLPLLGFHPLMLFAAHSISLVYQYWIHTELIGRMGPFEWVFNSPSHHRVHHGSDPKYLDRNHGGILIVWDRIFGTFVEEEERPTYGITENIDSYNVFYVAFHEWGAIVRDVIQARTWRGRLGCIFGPPGWRADGTGTTSKMLREAALKEKWDATSAPVRLARSNVEE